VRATIWNLTGVPNGDGFRIRTRAADNGTPSLTGESISNRTFAINRTGGDTFGPVIRAGSVRFSPSPPGAGALSRMNATADDTRSGDSPIAAAEFFWSLARPTAPNGTGVPLDAADGSFDQAVENLTFSGAFAVAPGNTCAWVHAEDASGNWGPFNTTCFVVIFTGPDVLPPAPATLSSIALANGNADVQVTWGKAWDDNLYGGTVRYRVWRAASAAGPFALASGNVTAAGSLSYSFVDPGQGTGNPANAFYRIETIDAANNSQLSPAIAAKTWLAVVPGLNLMGMSVDPGTWSVASMAGGLAWTEAWTYDACSGSFGWSNTSAGNAASLTLPTGRGFWFNATGAGRLLVLGIARIQVQVRLCAGWNLIALPGFLGNVTVGSLKAATGADLVVGFDPNDAYRTRILGDATPVVAGDGYWVRVAATATWTVAGW